VGMWEESSEREIRELNILGRHITRGHSHVGTCHGFGPDQRLVVHGFGSEIRGIATAVQN